MVEVAAGRRVAGHRLIEKIGEGHFGQVWKADYRDHVVALKIFTGQRKRSNVRREAFAQYALGRIEGPESRYFPHVDHVEIEQDPPWMRMEFIEGRPLEERLAGGALPLEQRLALGLEILNALAAIHRHDFVHGDLSPSNIMVTPDGGVKLLDVGYGALFDDDPQDLEISRDADERPLGVASPLYAAPERFKAEFLDGCGKPADVFSFGKILYRLVTGESPYVVKPVSMKFPALGKPWDDFVFRCLEEDPAARFADGQAALEEYRRIWKPEPAPGEFRAECPECRAKMSVPGGWAGERFACQNCGRALEVLVYDEESRHASTALATGSPSEEGIEFVEEPFEPGVVITEGLRARKFCPACGQSIYAEAMKCRYCDAWVNEVARRLETERRERERRQPATSKSFVMAAAATFAAYFLFWVPGALLNWHFLGQADALRRQTGTAPAGFRVLSAMMWVFVYLPVALLVTLLIAGLVTSVLAGLFV